MTYNPLLNKSPIQDIINYFGTYIREPAVEPEHSRIRSNTVEKTQFCSQNRVKPVKDWLDCVLFCFVLKTQLNTDERQQYILVRL